MTKIFKRGETVFVRPGAVSAYDNDPNFGGREVSVLRYDKDDNTYEVLESRHVKDDWFNAADIISLEEHRSLQIEKILNFFKGEADVTNFADLDGQHIMIDGSYDIDALINVLKEI